MERIEKLRSYGERFVQRPWYYVMRLAGRFVTVQQLVRHLPSRPQTPMSIGRTSLFPDLDVEEAVATLQRDGIFVGLQLPQSSVEQIRAYADTALCYANFVRSWNCNPQLGFPIGRAAEAESRIGRPIVAAEYFNASFECDVINQLSSDPRLLELSTRYLGRQPRWTGSLLRWTFATNTTVEDKAEYAQLFHFDLDDYAVLKFFFYITPVDDLSGPLICVRGSHRKRRVSTRYYSPRSRLMDDQVERFYGREAIKHMVGPPGTGFALDPFCIHKGCMPVQRNRLALHVQFVVNEYGFEFGARDPDQLKRVF